jgi:hypothetical protein
MAHCTVYPKANIAGVLTFDKARRIVVNVAKLPELLGAVLKTEEAFAMRQGSPVPSSSPTV